MAILWFLCRQNQQTFLQTAFKGRQFFSSFQAFSSSRKNQQSTERRTTMLKFFEQLEQIKKEVKFKYKHQKVAIVVERKDGFILYGEPIPSHQEHEISCRIAGAQVMFEEGKVFTLFI